MDLIKDVFKTQLVNFPTRGWAADNPSTIDFIYISFECKGIPSTACEAPFGKNDQSATSFLYDLKPGHREEVGERKNIPKSGPRKVSVRADNGETISDNEEKA